MQFSRGSQVGYQNQALREERASDQTYRRPDFYPRCFDRDFSEDSNRADTDREGLLLLGELHLF